MAGRKLPLSNNSFEELSGMGKMKYIGGWVGAVFGGVLALWQLTAFAGERADEYVAAQVAAAAPQIIQQELGPLQQQQGIFFYANQTQILRLELRTIESEMHAITRGKSPDELTAEDLTLLENLRTDRTMIRQQITANQQQQQQLQQQN